MTSVEKYTLKFYHHQLISFNLHPGIIKTVVTFESCTFVHRAQLAILWQLHTGGATMVHRGPLAILWHLHTCCATMVHQGPLAILWYLHRAPACNTFSISGGSPRACASVVVLLLWKLPPWCTTPRLMVHHTTHPGALRAEGDKLLLFGRCARNNFLLFRCCAQNIKPISTRGQKIEFMWPIYCKMSNM